MLFFKICTVIPPLAIDLLAMTHRKHHNSPGFLIVCRARALLRHLKIMQLHRPRNAADVLLKRLAELAVDLAFVDHDLADMAGGDEVDRRRRSSR